ncbi:MAG: hypothetical protein JXB42_04595 [Deltaproteobacteria bacterium]|nr:hypothetical protein [Deltaproteobacteria bacterium]
MLMCVSIDGEKVEKFIIERSTVSANTANVDLRCLRAVFNPSGNSPPVRVGMRAISNLAFAFVKDRLDK